MSEQQSTFLLNELLNDYKIALSWIEEVLEFKLIKGTRHRMYAERMDAHLRVGQSSNGAKLQNAFQSAVEITSIYDGFKENRTDSFKQKLRKTLGGIEDLEVDGGETVQRNYQFELYFCSELSRRGLDAQLSDPDVKVRTEHGNLYIECKRISKLGSVRRAIRKAKKKFKMTSPLGADERGLVAIASDLIVYNRIHDNRYPPLESVADVRDYVNLIAWENVKPEFKKQFPAYEVPGVIGFFVCGQFPWFTGSGFDSVRSFLWSERDGIGEVDDRFLDCIRSAATHTNDGN